MENTNENLFGRVIGYNKEDVVLEKRFVKDPKRTKFDTSTEEGLRQYIYAKLRAAFKEYGGNLVNSHMGREKLTSGAKVLIQDAQQALPELLKLEYDRTELKFPQNFQELKSRAEFHIINALSKFKIPRIELEAFMVPTVKGVMSTYCAIDVLSNNLPNYSIKTTDSHLDSVGIDIIAMKDLTFVNGERFVSNYYIQVKTISPDKQLGYRIQNGYHNSKGLNAMKPMFDYLLSLANIHSEYLRNRINERVVVHYSQDRQTIVCLESKSEYISIETIPILVLICPERYCVDYVKNPAYKNIKIESYDDRLVYVISKRKKGRLS